MRLTFLVSGGLLVACGGGGSDNRPDAKIFLDSGVDAASTCPIKCELKPPLLEIDLCEGDNYKAFSFGSDANPVGDGNPASDTPENWFGTFSADAGPLANRVFWNLGLVVSADTAVQDILFLRVVKPLNGGFGPLQNMALTFNPDANAADPVAFAFFLGDVTSNVPSQTLWATEGSITFTTLSETTGTIIKGATTPILWKQIDDMTGEVVNNGCSIKLGGVGGSTSGMSFVMKQTTAFQPKQSTEPRYINGMRVLTEAEMAPLNAYIDAHYSHLMK
jgi:hypothetical protein